MKIDSPFFQKFTHVGVMVKDTDKAAKHLESLGSGPFKLFDASSLPHLANKRYFCGESYQGKVKVFIAEIGQERLELFQPLERKSPWQEFLDDGGEGIHHIGYEVDDISKSVSRLIEQGAIVIHIAKQINNGGSVYLDIKDCGFILEIEKYWV